jgi:hypothetical protein
VRRLLASIVVAVLAAGCTGEDPKQPDTDLAMEKLISFARAPSDGTWAAVPLATSVDLGLGDSLRTEKSAQELRNPGAWLLNLDLFRARVGMSSALELIAAEQGALRVTNGPHPHCASPPVPPPRQVADLRRVVVQPRDPDSCLDWWTVDAFVNEDGKIEAVTFDVWEP